VGDIVPRLLLFLAVVTFGVWALVDVAQTPEPRIRLLSKSAWSLAVLIPVLGPALWFLQGRIPQPSGPAAQPRPLAPDDDPEFLRRLRGPDGSG
jgi:Phospholipase_D-nuclease N-terminal